MVSFLSSRASSSILFKRGKIGNLEIRNRFVRAATSETMADKNGGATDSLIRLHAELAEGEVGLQVLGHTYVHPTGKNDEGQTSLCDDSVIPSFRELTDAVHSHDGRIFAQLSHAGSYSRVPTIQPIAPSPVPNPLTGRVPKEMTNDDIREIIDAFGKAAGRAKKAGFDGVEIHGGHGYLISAFCSPYMNRREDDWGGSPEKRDRFMIEVYRRIREEVGHDYPITLKMGVEDMVENGLKIEESCRRAVKLEAIGLNAITVTCGIRTKQRGSTKTYIAVSGWRALKDLLFHRVFTKPEEEAFFAIYSKSIKSVVKIPVMLVGGIRSTEMMNRILNESVADFICLARPLIREPTIISQIKNGRKGLVDCTSCNICLNHSGDDPLRCWRKNPAWLLYHILLRVSRL